MYSSLLPCQNDIKFHGYKIRNTIWRRIKRRTFKLKERLTWSFSKWCLSSLTFETSRRNQNIFKRKQRRVFKEKKSYWITNQLISILRYIISYFRKLFKWDCINVLKRSRMDNIIQTINSLKNIKYLGMVKNGKLNKTLDLSVFCSHLKSRKVNSNKKGLSRMERAVNWSWHCWIAES